MLAEGGSVIYSLDLESYEAVKPPVLTKISNAAN